MSEKIKTYSPPTKEQKPLEVDGDNTGFEDILDKDGMINTKLNEKVIIQRIAKDLYKNASSGLRELYNNSARACRIAVKKGDLSNPLIHVTMNMKERILIIEDNGIGITKERFKKVLIELGTSDNLDKGEVGQFGMGFASYTTLSSVVIIDTKATNGDQYKMIAKDGMSFQHMGDSNLTKYGTRLEMICYPEVSFHELMEKFDELVRYSGIPTILELDGFEYYPSPFVKGDNKIHQTSFDDIASEKLTPKISVVDINTNDFRLIGFVSGEYTASNLQKVHLLNIPIGSDIELPFNWWVLNIKDERKFLPMPDRDKMRESSDKKMQNILNKAIKEHFADLHISNYKEFLDSPRKNEFFWLCNNLSEAPYHLLRVLNNLNGCHVRDMVYDTKAFNDSSIVQKMVENNDIIYQSYKHKGITQKIKELKPHAKLITIRKSKNGDWRRDVEFMKEFGIPDYRQILIDNKIKIPKREKSEFNIIGHTNHKYYNHDLVSLDSIDENVIRVDSVSISDLLVYVRRFRSPYTFVRNAVELDGYGCKNFSEWLQKDVPNIVCATNKGDMTIGEIGESGQEYIFCRDFEKEFECFFKNDERIVIYGEEQLLATLFYLNHNCETDVGRCGFAEPLNDVTKSYFSEFVDDKYGLRLYDTEDMKFFCSHMQEFHPCFHTLFGKLIDGIYHFVEGERKKYVFSEYLEKVKKYEPFNSDDEIAKLRFYLDENIKKINDGYNTTEVLQRLLDDTKLKIIDNEYFTERLLKEVLMPNVFGNIEVRSLENKNELRSLDYDVNLDIRDTEFSFEDNIKVFGFTLQFKDLKLKIKKGYCNVKVTVGIDT